MNPCSIFLIMLFGFLVHGTDAQEKDFFPLVIGAETRYSYFKETASYKSSFYYPGEGHDDYSKDSGIVVYKF